MSEDWFLVSVISIIAIAVFCYFKFSYHQWVKGDKWVCRRCGLVQENPGIEVTGHPTFYYGTIEDLRRAEREVAAEKRKKQEQEEYTRKLREQIKKRRKG